MAAMGRFLPVAILSPDRLVTGESGHWEASSKSHVYDIRERQQRVGSGHSARRLTLTSAVGASAACGDPTACPGYVLCI